MSSVDFIGGSEVNYMNYQGTDYVRTEDTDCGVLWYHDGDQGISEYIIEGQLEHDLEEAFTKQIKKNKDLYILLDTLQTKVGQDLLNDVMNLGMSLRQNQLNGSASKSGNEVLAQFTQDKVKQIKEDLKQ